MGLNLHIERHEKVGKHNVPQQVEWWDSGRCGGDVEFYLTDDFDWVYNNDPDDPGKRPVDFDRARAWVRLHIIEPNQPRLLEALDRMEEDPLLWLNGVW